MPDPNVADGLLDQSFLKELEYVVTPLPDRTVIPRLVHAPSPWRTMF